MATLQEAVEELAQKSPEEIAALLREKGIHGRRNLAMSCPLANYLTVETDITPFSVIVGPYSIIGDTLSLEHYSTPTPNSVAAFIKAFDSGKYPDLIEEEEGI